MYLLISFAHTFPICFKYLHEERCTLTANVNDGVRFCDMAMVKADLQERNVFCKRGMTNDNLRTKLEHVLREEEEWQGMVMYRRDQRFSIRDHDASYKDELDRTMLDILHMPMRMHKKMLNVLYGELLNGKTKNEVNAVKVRCPAKSPVEAAALGLKVSRLFENADGLPELYNEEAVYYRGREEGRLVHCVVRGWE